MRSRSPPFRSALRDALLAKKGRGWGWGLYLPTAEKDTDPTPAPPLQGRGMPCGLFLSGSGLFKVDSIINNATKIVIILGFGVNMPSNLNDFSYGPSIELRSMAFTLGKSSNYHSAFALA